MTNQFKPTRMIITELAKEYLNDKDYKRGFINKVWIDRVTNELKLKELNDMELCNMWDMVDLTLENTYHYFNENEEFKTAMKYLDVKSAFTEVVNVEARRRRESK